MTTTGSPCFAPTSFLTRSKREGARLQVGDADDVLVGHPQCRVARHFGSELLVAGQKRLHPRLVQRSVARALVVAAACRFASRITSCSAFARRGGAGGSGASR